MVDDRLTGASGLGRGRNSPRHCRHRCSPRALCSIAARSSKDPTFSTESLNAGIRAIDRSRSSNQSQASDFFNLRFRLALIAGALFNCCAIHKVLPVD
jgi:hypothetical protein